MKAQGVIDVIKRLGTHSAGRGNSDAYILRCAQATPEQAQDSLSSAWVVYTLPDEAHAANTRLSVNSRAMSIVVFNGDVWRLNVHKDRKAFELHVKSLDEVFWREVAA